MLASELTLETLQAACANVTEAFEELPHLSEAVYQRALQLELQRRGFTAVAEVVKPVVYMGMHVGTVRADLVVHGEKGGAPFVLELKRAPKITQSHVDQLLTYLALAPGGDAPGRAAATAGGAVVNFGRSPAEIHFRGARARSRPRSR